MKTTVKAGIVALSMVALGGCATSETLSSVSSTLDAVTPDVTLNQFIEMRMTSLQKEAAAGHGENLDALAELVGSDNKADFARMMQVNYEQLFTRLDQPQQLISPDRGTPSADGTLTDCTTILLVTWRPVESNLAGRCHIIFT